MPVISSFYGIIVRIYKENSSKHKTPHIHAEYSGEEIVMDFNGNVLEGDIPKNKRTLLEAWIEIHREELVADWNLISNGERVFKIEPLR